MGDRAERDAELIADRIHPLHRLSAGGDDVVSDQLWLTPGKVAEIWGVDRKTALLRLEAMNTTLGNMLLVKKSGPKRVHVRVNVKKLELFMSDQNTPEMKKILQRLRSVTARVRELEDRSA